MSEDKPKPKKPKGCPICGETPDGRYRPFCSKRCADIDLGRWFGERYVVPGDAPSDPGEDEGSDKA
jgi:endogenous inhibitor of DNA gyrase (YacG/DUF329 family)